MHFRTGNESSKIQTFICLLHIRRYISPFEASLQAHFNVCACTLVHSKHVVNNEKVFQKG